MSDIHPTAVVHPSAKLDSSVKIGPYAVIGEGVELGAGTTVGPHAVLEFCRLGRNNRLHAGCFVGTAPQDLKYAGERTTLTLGDDNVVRECVTLNRGTAAHGETRIGSGCLFMAYSHVAHDCQLGDHVILVNCVAVAGHVTIGDFTVVGGLAAIHQFQTIGRNCMIGGGSMINKDMPSFCTCQGYPANLRGLNVLGMRRAGFSREAVAAVKNAYRTLFLSGLRLEEAVGKLRAQKPGPEVCLLLESIERSKRGLMRPASGAEAEEEAVA
ncbi:MAG: acyl-ACP--UDP-N-acetylglucosamine O-acyltransferase [Elusimicrobia bacterium]|nr:acyl-ACP--UDP-N-acetylglucosamine O-acyltransferase [Elusimicrobiota bacterium]MDE2237012.1 acyl-ACP--UDP-N-acetylglucosamine O-acyltransferase [Elusimicrobiota bacterium]MDE2424367.1 acyl-ACP--UDP-N-acetylglucosamine O-acyltransferase [Elusimicrobiota bacterium]